MSDRDLRDLAVGDEVIREMAGQGRAPQALRVTEVRPDRIVCGPWEFDPETGAEIDLELHWGPAFGITGSMIRWPAEPGRSR